MPDTSNDYDPRASPPVTGLAKIWGPRLMPLVYDPFLWLGERRGMATLRRELTGRAGGRVLELGAGTGLNLSYYGTAVSDLVLSEPEPGMARRLSRRAERTPISTRVVGAPAERLPFDDASFDTVVATLVFCTVADPPGALSEARRVLVDGGRLLFLEHVRAASGSALERWQDRLLGPWSALACGCRCNQDTLGLIRDASFAVAEHTQERWRGMPAIVSPLVCGQALAI